MSAYSDVRRVRCSKDLPPKSLAVDSSGFSHSTSGEWFSVRLKKGCKRRFHAFHNAIDTDTLVSHAAGVKTKPGGNSRFRVSLVRKISKDSLTTVYYDKAYISRRNVQFIADVGAYPAKEHFELQLQKSLGT